MSLNISKHKRARRPIKPEYAWTGGLVGLFGGWISSAVVEVAIGKPKMSIMIVGGLGGLLLGFAVEGVRYWWRLRRYHIARKMFHETK